MYYFADKCKIDFDVFLPTRNRNLQRDFVWTIDQKRELIWSILLKRYIPPMAMINIADGGNRGTNGVYQVIDGKQRLSAMIDFYKGAYTLEVEGGEYYFNQLPLEYQRVVSMYMFPYYIVHEDYSDTISDEDKINWFKLINFAGTPQDAKHLKGL